MKFLHLVLFSKEKHYERMITTTKPYYKLFADQIQTVYYHRDPDIDTPVLNDSSMTLTLPGKETYFPGILEKTIQALEFFKLDFDFVIRSNASTVVNIPNILTLLHSNPDFFYGAPHIMQSDTINTKKQIAKELLPLDFAQGTCIVMHRMAVNLLLANKHRLNFDIEDDPAIALLFKEIFLETKTKCIEIEQQQIVKSELLPKQIGLQYAAFEKHYNIDTVTAFRNHHFESNREIDVKNVQQEVIVLQQRYELQTKPKALKKIFYYGKNITPQVKALCNPQWATNGDNLQLDRLFGDPQPGTIKQLQLFFEDQEALLFDQSAILHFLLHKNVLYVS